MKVIKKKKLEQQLDDNMLKQQEIKDRYAVEVNNFYNTLNIEEREQVESVKEEVEKNWTCLNKNTLEKETREGMDDRWDYEADKR